jgi:hypothetical protein
MEERDLGLVTCVERQGDSSMAFCTSKHMEMTECSRVRGTGD